MRVRRIVVNKIPIRILDEYSEANFATGLMKVI